MALVVADPASAEGGLASYANGSIRKLGRGIANVVTCEGELFRVTDQVWRQDGFVAASILGPLKGTWRTALRALAGAYDIGTFLIPLPKGFEPVMKPEFVFAHGDWAE